MNAPYNINEINIMKHFEKRYLWIKFHELKDSRNYF